MAVALHGQDPRFLRRIRVQGGWRSRGLGAAHPDATPPAHWAEIGQRWAGEQHVVIDVTAFVAPGTNYQPRVVVMTDVRLPLWANPGTDVVATEPELSSPVPDLVTLRLTSWSTR